MDVEYNGTAGGSLQIATEVVEKIARVAASEIDGVASISMGNVGVKSILNKIAPQNPICVELKDAVADITIHLVVRYGTKISDLSEKVQRNIKASIQNMTQIMVAKVNIVVTGIELEQFEPAFEDIK